MVKATSLLGTRRMPRIPSVTFFTQRDYTRESDVLAEGGIGKLWDTGLRTDLVWAYTRVKTASSFFTINPRHESSVAFEATQPLLQGFGAAVSRSALARALNDKAIADAEFEITLETELLRAYRAYWDLALAAEDLSIQEASLQLAEEQVSIAEDRLAVGVAAKLEVTGAQAAAARQREAVIGARTSYRRASDRLLLVIRPSRKSEAYDLRVIPTTRPEAEEAPSPVDPARAVADALANRPELRRENLRIANADLDLLVADDARNVRLDVFGRFGIEGAAGTGRDSLDNLGSGDFRDWSVGLSLEFLFDAKARRARWRQAMLNRREGELRRERSAAKILVEVRAALFEFETARERFEATAQTRALAQEQYEGEVDRLRAGRSTPYQVELFRRDLLDAERNRLQSQVGVYVARAVLESTRGAFAREIVESSTSDKASR